MFSQRQVDNVHLPFNSAPKQPNNQYVSYNQTP